MNTALKNQLGRLVNASSKKEASSCWFPRPLEVYCQTKCKMMTKATADYELFNAITLWFQFEVYQINAVTYLEKP